MEVEGAQAGAEGGGGRENDRETNLLGPAITASACTALVFAIDPHGQHDVFVLDVERPAQPVTYVDRDRGRVREAERQRGKVAGRQASKQAG